MCVYVNLATTSSLSTPTKQQETPQRVQIMRTPDGRITVKGLLPGQQLVQYPDGKLQVMTPSQIQSAGLAIKTPTNTVTVQKPATTPTTPIKPATNSSATPTTGNVLLQQQLQSTKVLQQTPIKAGQQVVIKQQVGTPVTTQKITTSGQVIQQQVVMGGNQLLTTPTGQQVSLHCRLTNEWFDLFFMSLRL